MKPILQGYRYIKEEGWKGGRKEGERRGREGWQKASHRPVSLEKIVIKFHSNKPQMKFNNILRR